MDKNCTHGHQDVRTNSSSLVFTRVVAASSQPSSASGKHVNQISEGIYHLQLIRSDRTFTLRSAINRVWAVLHAPCTTLIRVSAFEPAAFGFAANAVDVVTTLYMTDRALGLTCKIKPCRRSRPVHDDYNCFLNFFFVL